MTTTASAAATGLPASIHALHDPMPRRGFLAGLAKLPLIGGSVALIGQPKAVAGQATPEMIEAYKTWLALELRFLGWRMADDPYFLQATAWTLARQPQGAQRHDPRRRMVRGRVCQRPRRPLSSRRARHERCRLRLA